MGGSKYFKADLKETHFDGEGEYRAQAHYVCVRCDISLITLFVLGKLGN